MPEMELLPSQKNQVFLVVKGLDCDISEFELKEQRDPYYNKTGYRLIHKPSGYYYTLGYGSPTSRVSVYEPGVNSTFDRLEFKSFFSQITHIHKWFSYMRREVESPDLWASIAQEREFIDAASQPDSNAPFSDEEKQYISNGLNEIKQYLLTAHKLDPELVEGKINYLLESSGRMGRKDWINILIATIIAIITDAYLPPERTRDIVRFVAAALKNILGGAHLLLTSTT